MPEQQPTVIIVSPEILASALSLLSETKESQSFLSVFAESSSWTLSTKELWINVSEPEVIAPGCTQWTLTIKKNAGEWRETILLLQSEKGKDFSIVVKQPGGAWVEEQASMTLLYPVPPPSTPRLAFPLAMELGVAGKFIAQQLKKLPLPAMVVAFVVVSLAIVGAGVAAGVTRKAFYLVPEPPDYFQDMGQPTAIMPMTDFLIIQQVLFLIVYIAESLVA